MLWCHKPACVCNHRYETRNTKRILVLFQIYSITQANIQIGSITQEDDKLNLDDPHLAPIKKGSRLFVVVLAVIHSSVPVSAQERRRRAPSEPHRGSPLLRPPSWAVDASNSLTVSNLSSWAGDDPSPHSRAFGCVSVPFRAHKRATNPAPRSPYWRSFVLCGADALPVWNTEPQSSFFLAIVIPLNAERMKQRATAKVFPGSQKRPAPLFPKFESSCKFVSRLYKLLNDNYTLLGQLSIYIFLHKGIAIH